MDQSIDKAASNFRPTDGLAIDTNAGSDQGLAEGGTPGTDRNGRQRRRRFRVVRTSEVMVRMFCVLVLVFETGVNKIVNEFVVSKRDPTPKTLA
jgi:hypothetical protein